MKANPSALDLRQTGVLLRGEPDSISRWVQEWNAARVLLYLAIIVVGSAAYGAATGLWRAPLQSFYTAAKFPLLLLLTTFGNALLNGMLAPLLGLNIGFRQCLLAILISFTIGAAILGAFSPLIVFLDWNVPAISEKLARNSLVYSLMLVTHVSVIAFAGIAANLRLLQLLRRLSNVTVARKVLFAWLAGNLFLGSQSSWILRPFIGSPRLPIEFLRSDAFHGSFYDALFSAVREIFFR